MHSYCNPGQFGLKCHSRLSHTRYCKTALEIGHRMMHWRLPFVAVKIGLIGQFRLLIIEIKMNIFKNKINNLPDTMLVFRTGSFQASCLLHRSTRTEDLALDHQSQSAETLY